VGSGPGPVGDGATGLPGEDGVPLLTESMAADTRRWPASHVSGAARAVHATWDDKHDPRTGMDV
jgi:hypothetical protein